MVLGIDQLQKLRACCRDEAAFAQLRQILGLGLDENLAEQAAAHYRAILDASPDLMFRSDHQGKYLDFHGEHLIHIAREDIVGKYLPDFLPPDVAALCLRAIQRTLATGQLQICAYQLPSADGLRDYEARIAVSGKNEVLSIVQDVTERNRVEVALRDSEERLKSFFEATFEAVIIHDFQQILDVNPAAEDLLGYTTAELIGMSVLDLVAPASLDLVRERWRSLANPDDPYDYEAVGVRKDGSLFTAVVSAKVIAYRGQRVRVASIRDVTARKQAEARYRAMVNAMPDLMFRIRRDGTYLDCKADNDDALLLPAQQLIGKNVRDVLPPDLADQRMYWVEQTLVSGQPQHFEYQLCFSGQSKFSELYQQFNARSGVVSSDESIRRDYEARVVVSGSDEVLAIVRDITDRTLADAALRLSEEKFSKAFRSSPNPMSIATLLEGRMIDVNDGFLAVMGYGRDDVIDRYVRDFNIWVNPSDREQAVKALQQHGSIRNVEYLFRTKSGEVRVGLISAEVITINGEQCLIDVIVDITELKRAEQQIRAAAERDRLLAEIALRVRQSLELQQILNTSVVEVRRVLQADRVCIGHDAPDGSTVIVAESVDPRWQSSLGLVIDDPAFLRKIREEFADGQAKVIHDVRDEVYSPNMEILLNDLHVKASLVAPLMLEDQLFGFLATDQCDAPRRWEQEEVDFLTQLGTQVSIAIQQANLYQQVRDLNTGLEQKVQERTLQLQQKNAELQDLNDLKDEFLNAFSHDLKTPVMGISLIVSNLLNQPGEMLPVARSTLERMLQSITNQLQLIKSMLEAHSAETRGVSLHYELVQLSLLTQVIVEDLEPLVNKNTATLYNHVPPDLPLVNADPVQLRRVFENLITNALNHNPPGVEITLDAQIDQEMIRFTLHDNGVGMSQETCDRLFQRYARGPNSRHSTGIGLGLYLCRQIITAHGGQIGVASVRGQGSTFWLTLPLAIPPSRHSISGEG